MQVPVSLGSRASVAIQRLAETGHLVWLALRLTWRSSPVLVGGIAVLLALEAAVYPVQLASMRFVVDRAALELGLVEPGTIHRGGAGAALLLQVPLAWWIIVAALLLIVRQLVSPIVSTLQSLAGDQLSGYVLDQVMRVANRWPGLARFEDPAFADDLQRARRQGARGGLEMLTYGGRAAVMLFTAIGLAVVLGSLHPLLPLLLVLATVPQMLWQWQYRHRTNSHLYGQTPETRRLEYSRDLLLQPEPAKDVRLYRLGPFLLGSYDAIFTRTMAALDRLRLHLTLPVTLASMLAAAAGGAVYAYVAWGIVRGERSIGELVLYGGAATMLQDNLLGLGFQIGFLPLPLGFLPSVFRVLDAPPDLPLPVPGKRAPRPLREGIVFEHVSFAYPPGVTHGPATSAQTDGAAGAGAESALILHDVSFTIRPGECVALVGHNGAGKTTLIKLLLRLYDPTAGRILVDGTDLREYDLADLRREMGVIFQDFVRYELTAGENIALGALDALTDHARLQLAAARAGAEDLLTRLPLGLETALGREFGGRELSGGEWQKLALARAFVRDCQVLVLDEPTASLDPQTEYDIYQRFRDLTRGRSTVLISHRFSTVRMADRIVYLAQGTVAEQGGHAQLIARNGEYARLYRLQASAYFDRTAPPNVEVQA